jgi:hypothetical protein
MRNDLSCRSFVLSWMWFELAVWCFLTYSSICYGKLFDYEFTDTEDFIVEISEGDNWYYDIIFGDLNVKNIDLSDQRIIQGKFL